MINRCDRWRSHIASRRLAYAPGAHDALSARIIAAAGFNAVYLGGNAIALAIGKGQPFITLTETVEVATCVCRSVDVPVIVDAGAGFGGPSHLHGAVRDIEYAGVAALHIDDQLYPKSPDYHRNQAELVTVDAMAARIGTACDARRNPAFSIIARTDALRVTGAMTEVVDRARACADAGADGLIVLDMAPEQAAFVREAVPDLPLYWIGGVHPPIPGRDALAAAGFSAALLPFNGIAEITARLSALWTRLAATGAIDQDDALLAQARTETLSLAGMQAAWDIEDERRAR